jgi:expansin (peptidoglycan-binding protein)
MGTPKGDSSVVVADVAPHFSDSSLSFFPRALESLLALTDGRSLVRTLKKAAVQAKSLKFGGLPLQQIVLMAFSHLV